MKREQDHRPFRGVSNDGVVVETVAGKILVEFHELETETGRQRAVMLSLLPSEAKRLARMLARKADQADGTGALKSAGGLGTANR